MLSTWTSLKHGCKHGLHDGQTRRSQQRYPGRCVGSPWMPAVPACRAPFAGQAPWKARGGLARPLRLWLKHGGKHGLHDGQTRRSRQRYPGRCVGSPWMPAVPACRAPFAGQAPW